MGDYTSMSGYLHAVPKYKTRGVARLFNKYGIDEDYNDYYPTTWDGTMVRSMVNRGLNFTSSDFRCGDSGELADGLQAQGCTFELHEEPRYEWLGELHMFHPKLGRMNALCDANGEPLIPISMFRAIEEEGGGVRERHAKMREKLGIDYLDAYWKEIRL